MNPKTQIYDGRWSAFPVTYCKKEIECIAKMIATRHSGIVVGGSGVGKSNLSGFLATRTEAILPLLPRRKYLFCLVDINNFPQKDAIGFYRGMLHALYKAAKRQNLSIANDLYRLEREPLQWNDEQSWIFALEEAHELVINQAGYDLVWLLDRFDKACPTLEHSTLDTLRSLRDDDLFYGKLIFLAFSRKPLQRLRDWEANSEFLEIVEGNTCWVGPLTEADTRWRIQNIAHGQPNRISEIGETMIVWLTGGLAAFVKVASETWLQFDEITAKSMSLDKLQHILLKHDGVRRTCQEILKELEPIERETLLKIAVVDLPQISLNQQAIEYLVHNGLLTSTVGNLKIFSPLFSAYLNDYTTKMPGFVSVDAAQKIALRDGVPLNIELTKTEYSLLSYMISNPNKVLTFDELIAHLYPLVPEEDRDDQKQALVRQVNNLQAKLVKEELGDRISNHRGHGYKFFQPELPEEYKWLRNG